VVPLLKAIPRPSSPAQLVYTVCPFTLNSFPMYVCSTHTIFERTEGHLVAFIEIAFISILSRRLARLNTQEISA